MGFVTPMSQTIFVWAVLACLVVAWNLHPWVITVSITVAFALSAFWYAREAYPRLGRG